ncbi:MAG: hydantoinase/oxoprolinase family protein, partial [Chromatiales bacterium]|nr:hydantoinase/oxoprolinase family protein [Chromatiales bacterium]
MTTLDKANGGIEIGVDTGGTFTDLVSVSATGERHIVKVPSTPHDPSEAILTGIAAVLRLSGHDAVEVQRLVHGTTVATNAVLERKGAKTGIIATEGFSDVLEIGRQMRSAVYDLELTPQTPVFLAPGARRTEVQERISASGEVLQALDEPSVLNALQQLVDQGVESVAVALLFAFLDARHEQRIAALAQQHFAHLSVSLSSEVDPAFREYERTVATAFDAYTKPILTRYLSRMAQALSERGVQAPFQVMHSRGGITSAASAAERPVRLFLSGPAAGVI